MALLARPRVRTTISGVALPVATAMTPVEADEFRALMAAAEQIVL